MLCVTLGGLVPTMRMIIFACVFEYVWTQMAENEQIKVKNQVRVGNTGQDPLQRAIHCAGSNNVSTNTEQ